MHLNPCTVFDELSLLLGREVSLLIFEELGEVQLFRQFLPVLCLVLDLILTQLVSYSLLNCVLVDGDLRDFLSIMNEFKFVLVQPEDELLAQFLYPSEDVDG